MTAVVDAVDGSSTGIAICQESGVLGMAAYGATRTYPDARIYDRFRL